MSFWFWLTTIYEVMWWCMPMGVAQTAAAFYAVSVIILFLLLEALAPPDENTYVPRRRRGRSNRFITAVLSLLSRCGKSIETNINNLKVRRRYRPPRLRYTGQRPRRKKGKCNNHKDLAGMTTTWANGRNASPRSFDSDSQTLMLDDGKVKGIKGHARATHRGTIKWYIEDDHGLVHVMIITGAYLIPEAATRILSPQHLAQQANDHYPIAEGTGALTTSKSITLFWAQRRFTKTVPLDPQTNVGLTTTAPGTRDFRSFCATVTTPETKQTHIFTTHIIPDEEDDESFQPKDPVQTDTPEETEQVKPPDEVMTEAPKASLVDMGPINHVIPDDREPTSLDPHDELLRWHYRLGHLSFDRIKQLASAG